MFILKGLPLLVGKLSNNRLVPEHFEHREIWHKPAGGFVLPWMRKLTREDKKFWLPEDDTPATLPIPAKDEKETYSRSSHDKVSKNDLPSPSHPLSPAGVHKAVETTQNEKYEV